MTTSYDTPPLALAFLAALYGVEVSVSDQIPRTQCLLCNEHGAVTTVRVHGDTTGSTKAGIVDCCVHCMDAIARTPEATHLEIAAVSEDESKPRTCPQCSAQSWRPHRDDCPEVLADSEQVTG